MSSGWSQSTSKPYRIPWINVETSFSWFSRISREISGFRAKFRANFGGILSQKKTVIRSYLAKFSKKSYSVKKIEKLHPNAIQKVPLGLSTPLVARVIVIFQDFARNSGFRAKFRAKKWQDNLPKKNSNSALSRQIFKKIKFCKKNRKDVPKCYSESTLRPPRASCSARNRPRLFFGANPSIRPSVHPSVQPINVVEP